MKQATTFDTCTSVYMDTLVFKHLYTWITLVFKHLYTWTHSYLNICIHGYTRI